MAGSRTGLLASEAAAFAPWAAEHPDAALECDALAKDYGDGMGLHGLDLVVGPGQLHRVPALVEEHLVHGRPVREWVLGRVPSD